MNINRYLVPVLILGLLLQSACTPSSNASSSDSCPPTTPGINLLKESEGGYCLLYPAEYSTSPSGYIVINPVSGSGDIPGEAWVSITTESAGGLTADQIAEEQIAEIGAGFNITRSDQPIEGETAIVIDGLPGQDSNRKVLIVHDDRLYTLTFAPWYPSPAGTGKLTPLEDLYNMIMSTIHFLIPA